MIKHIVFFRFTGKLNGDDRKHRAGKLAEIFSPLEKLDCVNEYRTGINFSESENAWDFVIDSTFQTAENLEKYRISNEHQAAIKAAKIYSKDKSVIDYKIQNK